MRIFFRFEGDFANEHVPHRTVRVFINGASCGLLTMRVEEFDDLFRQLRNGWDQWQDVRSTGDGLEETGDAASA